MELHLNSAGHSRAAELAEWIGRNPERVEELRDTPELIKKKERILTSFYKTGRIDGLYFGRASNSKRNHVKEYIKGCLYRARIKDETLIEDCYNELFIHLQSMPAHKFCAMYDLAPAKVLATSLKIIALKCFAVDPRYGNPRHSLIQFILHTATGGDNVEIDLVERLTRGDSVTRSEYNDTPISYKNLNEIKSINVSVDDFTESYGFTPEDIIGHLNPEELAVFYKTLGRQPRGKTSADTLAARGKLFDRLREIKLELERNI